MRRSSDFRIFLNGWRALYDEIIVVPKVLDELLHTEERAYCQKMIDSGRWRLIDPLEELGEQFLVHYQQVQRDFAQFQVRRAYKQTTDKADIQILALCLTLDLPIITSNDSDFKSVIELFDYRVSPGEDLEAEEKLIRVDGLLEFALMRRKKEIAKLSVIRKFVNVSAPEKQKEKILFKLKEQ